MDREIQCWAEDGVWTVWDVESSLACQDENLWEALELLYEGFYTPDLLAYALRTKRVADAKGFSGWKTYFTPMAEPKKRKSPPKPYLN